MKNKPMEERTPKIKDLNGFVFEWNAPDPNNIYRKGGTYTRWNELRNEFKYRLCRRIRGCGSGDLTTLFKAVCLYIALKNEKSEAERKMRKRTMPTKESPHEIEMRNGVTPQYWMHC